MKNWKKKYSSEIHKTIDHTGSYLLLLGKRQLLSSNIPYESFFLTLNKLSFKYCPPISPTT